MTVADAGWPSQNGVMTPEQEEIRAEFRRRRGYWADDWQLILELAPDIMAAYTDMSAYPWEHGTLDPKTRELIYFAATASVTHIHPIGIETHGRKALAEGATKGELVTLLALVSAMGIVGYRLAVDVLEEVSPGSTATDLPAERLAQLRARFEQVFGCWDDGVTAAIESDPSFFDKYLTWAAASRVSGILTPRLVSLVSIAVNAIVTHLDRATLRREVAVALAAGVTPGEITEVCQIIAGVSVHSLTVGVPIVAGLATLRED